MASPPTTERAQTGFGSWPFGASMPWSVFVDQVEHVGELRWPLSVGVYDVMRTDPQLSGLIRGSTLPIRRYEWRINPNGARPEIVEGIAEDFNIPVAGRDPGPRKRARNRFSHDAHLRLALQTGIVQGHAFFEQYGKIIDGLWRLRKLGFIPPHTITGINVAKDGMLDSIEQTLGLGRQPLEIGRLVAFIYEYERGNWVGRSALRDCYKPWLIKDRLVRVDAINHEKAGGVHVPEAPPNASAKEIGQLSEMAQSLVVGEYAGGAVPSGTKWNVVGPKGTDVITSIRYCDEAMARKFLMMFMQLGHTETGSRALGESFIDFFSMAQETDAIWYRDVMNEHVIEDWVDWNYGEGEELCPLLEFVRPSMEADPPAGELARAVEQGDVVVDEELKAALDESLGRGRGRRAVAAAADESGLNLPDRTLRRAPYEHEIKAAVDFAAIDSTWQSERDALVAAWMQIQAGQIDDLHAKIAAAAGDVAKLASVEAAPAGAEVVEAAMSRLAAAGAAEALREAAQQGVSAPTLDLEALGERLAARASATETLLARSFGEAASRRATSLAGGSLSATEIADSVRDYLGGLSQAYLEEQLGGVLSQAQLSGRKEVFAATDPAQIYASELLDANTCGPCTEVDGTQYGSLEEAEADYPAGGFSDCDGGPRCRGTLVAVYDEAAPSA